MQNYESRFGISGDVRYSIAAGGDEPRNRGNRSREESNKRTKGIREGGRGKGPKGSPVEKMHV